MQSGETIQKLLVFSLLYILVNFKAGISSSTIFPDGALMNFIKAFKNGAVKTSRSITNIVMCVIV